MKKLLLILLSVAFFSISGIAVCFFLLHDNLIYDFKSLPDFQRYAATHNEIPQNDIRRLHVGNFYKQQQPFSAQILEALNIYSFMHTNIDHITQLFARLQKGIEVKSESMKITLTSDDSNVYVWGNLHGSLHTLVRSLDWLHKQNIISQELIISKPDTYFVFYDSVLYDSVYGLETLLLVGLLQERNPQSVIYVKDSYEQKNNWQNHTLQIQLQEILGYKFHITKDLNYAINNFFDSLVKHVDFITPSGTTLSITTDSQLRIKHDTLTSQSVAIGTMHGPVKYLKQPGIYLLEQQYGIPTWLVVSTSNTTADTGGFAVINLASSIAQSTISFLQKNDEQFEQTQQFNLVTGGNPGITTTISNPVTFGSTMSLDLGVPAMGKSVQSGILAYINQINQSGGIDNKLVKLVVLNDNYIPYLARQNIEKLLKEAIDTIILPIGSPTLTAYLDLVEQQKIAVLFPITGSAEFRKPTLTNLINYRASYGDEMSVVVDYLVKEFGLRKFAFFYQDDAFGKSALGPAHQALQKHGITEWVDIPYTRGSVLLQEQVTKIKELQPEALGLLSTANSTKELIRLIGVNNLTGTKLFGVSFLGEETFRYFTHSAGLSVIYGAVVPNPHTSNLPIVTEYRAAMDALKNRYNNFSLEAYICGAILADVISTLTKPITKEKIIKALEALNHHNVKGIPLTFNPNTRTISSNVWIETGKTDKWIQKEIEYENVNNR